MEKRVENTPLFTSVLLPVEKVALPEATRKALVALRAQQLPATIGAKEKGPAPPLVLADGGTHRESQVGVSSTYSSADNAGAGGLGYNVSGKYAASTKITASGAVADVEAANEVEVEIERLTEQYDRLEIVGPPVVPLVDANSLKFSQLTSL